ncbi:hypothetical protein [Paenibacillus sp.]|uniref:hypothetical protein n=1 Tax=Paenibacillus sp. TaxID=58172 RepID=UPI002D612654|nr:hypothetical protein [Paenibacillus sp.]HZG87889.1 hypothetical protein [Paenibacillus sp.]
MKKVGYTIITLVLVLFTLGFYQFQKPILNEQEAVTKAKVYLQTVNRNLDLTYNTDFVELRVFNKDTFLNKATGNRTWYIHIDGVAILLEADTGEFIRMVFPLDGVITKEEHPDWFR